MKPAVAEADKVLESDSVDHLVKHLAETVAAEIEYVHHVERLNNDAAGKATDHRASNGGESHGGHHQ